MHVEVPPASWRSRLKRWRWWIAAVRVHQRAGGAAFILRAVVASQASEALHARVAVRRRRTWRVWKGGVRLDDVAV